MLFAEGAYGFRGFLVCQYDDIFARLLSGVETSRGDSEVYQFIFHLYLWFIGVLMCWWVVVGGDMMLAGGVGRFKKRFSICRCDGRFCSGKIVFRSG